MQLNHGLTHRSLEEHFFRDRAAWDVIALDFRKGSSATISSAHRPKHVISCNVIHRSEKACHSLTYLNSGSLNVNFRIVGSSKLHCTLCNLLNTYHDNWSSAVPPKSRNIHDQLGALQNVASQADPVACSAASHQTPCKKKSNMSHRDLMIGMRNHVRICRRPRRSSPVELDGTA